MTAFDPGVRLSLTAENTTAPGNRWVVNPNGATIGRDHERVEIVIGDALVSRVHARVELTEQGYVITNLTTNNQVWVNGSEVRRAILQDGDLVRLGSTDLRVAIQQR